MENNFNLKKFLVENKLTRVSRLREQEENYKYFDEEGIGGMVIGSVEGKTVYGLEDSSVYDTMFYAIETGEGVDFISIETGGELLKASEIISQLGANKSRGMVNLILQDINRELGENKLTSNSRMLKENVQILNTKGTYVEFMYQDKLRKVDFDNYEPTEGHGSGYSTGYISGEDQFGNEWAMDAEFDMGSPIDWDQDTIEMI